MNVLLIGAGGHARVIAEIVQLMGFELLGFLDDDADLKGQKLAGSLVLDTIQAYENYSFDKMIIGIGSNFVRQKLITGSLSVVPDEQWFTAIHPKSIISPSAKIGHGTAIMAGAIVNCDVTIKNHVIINTGATIDHECVIEDYAHIAPGTNLAGGVLIGIGSLMGIASSAIPYCKVGSWSTVGAGATVVHDIEDFLTVVGTPARPITK
jgi:sugar O-acyltransferase (sialic acid O-acetyltransferase NeuD family)